MATRDTARTGPICHDLGSDLRTGPVGATLLQEAIVTWVTDMSDGPVPAEPVRRLAPGAVRKSG